MMFFKQIERAMVEMINLHYNPTPEEAITYEKFILHNGHGWFWESEDYEHPTHVSVAMQLIDEGDLAEEELDDCVMGRNYGDFIYAYTFYLSPKEAEDEIRVFYDLPVDIEGADESNSASIKTSTLVGVTTNGVSIYTKPQASTGYSEGIIWDDDYELYWAYDMSGEKKAMHGDVLAYIMNKEDSFASSYESDKFRHENITDNMLYGNYWVGPRSVEMNTLRETPEWAIERAFDRYPEAIILKVNDERYKLRHPNQRDYQWFGGSPDTPLHFQENEEEEPIKEVSDSNSADDELGEFKIGDKVLTIVDNLLYEDRSMGKVPLGTSAEIIGFVEWDVPILKTEDGYYVEATDDDVIIDPVKTACFNKRVSILHFQKVTERSDVERKADKIYNSGGVEFVVATPDEERQRTLWEFNVTSTTGQTYPLYGDTTMENPTRWIDWFDVACSCDWGRWNYDRAPEYRHLERFPCSHSMATEKWLSQNGMREQERARRENQTQRPAPASAPTPVAQPAPSAIRQPIGLPSAQQGTNDAPATPPPAAPAARQAPSPEPAPPPPEPTVVRPVFRDQVLRPRTPLRESMWYSDSSLEKEADVKESQPSLSEALQDDDLYWRLHWSDADEFSPSNAESVNWSYRGVNVPDIGYSCFQDPSRLVDYFSAMDEELAENEEMVVAFSGKYVGLGEDGEDLAIPDMKKVYWYTWDEFVETVIP